MIQQGLIEKVVVPSNKRKTINGSVKCFRLVTADEGTGIGEVDLIAQPQGDEEEKEDGSIGFSTFHYSPPFLTFSL